MIAYIFRSFFELFILSVSSYYRVARKIIPMFPIQIIHQVYNLKYFPLAYGLFFLIFFMVSFEALIFNPVV